MPRSLILRTVAIGLLFVLALFAVYVFLQGHNAPGGGFIAGLIASAMILIQYLSFPRNRLEQTFSSVYHNLVGFGVLIAASSGLIGIVVNDPFLTGYHWDLPLPGGGHLGIPSVVLFDLGVFLVVVGTVIGIFRALQETKE